MIHCSSAGRSGVLAHLLAPDAELATHIGAWVDRLVSTAASLGIALNTRSIRSLFSTPIEDLEDICAKSHPGQLRGFGAMDSTTAQVLEQWCARATCCLSALGHVAHQPSSSAAAGLAEDPSFPVAVALSRYQRNALGAYLQVANDALAVLTSLLHLAQAPYGPLFSSNLTAEDIACCRTACADLATLFAWGHRWLGDTPVDRRRPMIYEHFDDAQIALMLLFEGIPEHQRRQILVGLLIGLAGLKRRI